MLRYAKSSPVTIALDSMIVIVCHLEFGKSSSPDMRFSIDVKIDTEPRKIAIGVTI